MVMKNGPAKEEYKEGRPGCYKCKQPISEKDDFYRLTWIGKTWEVIMNYHIHCLIEAVQAGDIRAEHG